MDKKTKILTCAKQLFLEQGYKSTSIQTIANESGISKGAVYLYFNSKDEILLAIFRMLEEAVWQKVAEINSDPNLSAREKFRRQIVTFYNEILENLQFNQMMLNESGVELSEAFYNYAREYRYKLQNVQEQSLLNIYGESVRPWISDLVISINGIMQEFDASILLDNLELQSEQLADFVCHVADSIVAGLLETKPEPIFGDEARKIRSDFLTEIESQKQKKLQKQFEEIAESALAIQLDSEQKEMVDETLNLLKDAVLSKEINKVLIKALLTNLTGIKELKKQISQLKILLDIK
ncbi:MAG: TetR/AcrR family transcriptional regulator [Kangiellaceae bacterium]|nr:TetR/AcrR family transcriptional regulator [Kangiellaceae bacterium]